MVKGGNRAGTLVQRSINIKEGCLTEFHFLFYEQNTIFEGGNKRKEKKAAEESGGLYSRVLIERMMRSTRGVDPGKEKARSFLLRLKSRLLDETRDKGADSEESLLSFLIFKLR